MKYQIIKTITFFTILFLYGFSIPSTIYANQDFLFNKKYSKKHFNEALNENNLKELIDYMQSTSLKLYGIQGVYNLDKPSQSMKKAWEKRKKANRKKGHPLHAMFFRGDRDFISKPENESGIIIIQETDYTILLHEFLHYLFQKERKKEKNYLTRKKLEIKKSSFFDEFKKSLPKVQKSPQIFQSKATQLIKISWKQLLSTSLEESVIGYLLIKKNQEGKLSLNHSTKKTHCLHAIKNTKISKRPFDAFSNLFDKMKKKYSIDELDEIEEKNKKKISSISKLHKKLKKMCSA